MFVSRAKYVALVGAHEDTKAELSRVKAALDRETSRLAQEREAKRQLQAKVDRMTAGLKQNRPKIAA